MSAMPIQVLDPTVAAQIAAGEVIERPASVVKELLENSLDAGARRINIEARGGGVEELKVQDDGCGIAADEVEQAFFRHATSKLRQADDLWNIHTFGFRGEALPSIASVAQVTCITRSAADEAGTELRIAGGEVQARMPRGCSPGTSIRVRHLFYNTPVRREYLRAHSTEMSAISTVVQQYALAYPEVRFSLLLDGRLALQTGGSGDVRDVLIEIYGLEVARQLLPVETGYGEGDEAITISGMISPPGLTRSSRNSFHLFVNRRAIQSRGLLAHIIEEAYHTLLMKGRHPLVVLNIQVPPSEVDVNVHPTKSEVRFRHQSRVTGLLGRAVREALLEGADVQVWGESAPSPPSAEQEAQPDEARQIGLDSRADDPAHSTSSWGVGKRAWNTRYSRWDVGGGMAAGESESAAASSTARQEPAELFEQESSDHSSEEARQPDHHGNEDGTGDEMGSVMQATEKTGGADESSRAGASLPAEQPAPDPPVASRLPPLRIVGQVGLTYIVAESPHGMYLIDQHATHERIAYERLMAQYGGGAIESQELLMPQAVEVPPSAAAVLLSQVEALQRWGFALEEWGEGRLQVRAVPSTLLVDDLQQALLEIADHLEGKGGSTPDEWREAMLTTLSCHTSVRAGQALAFEEMRELLHQLERCTNPHTCPHGRPTMVLLTPGQLERQFGRQV